MFFNSPFLALPFTLVCCSPSPHPHFFHIPFVVLPKCCCSPSTIIISFYHSIVEPRVFCSFCNSPLSPSTIVSFFSHNYVVLFTVAVLTQCSCSFPKNSRVFFPQGFVLLRQSYCSFTNIPLSTFTMLLSQFCCLISLHCYYFFKIILILSFFHNSILAERRSINFVEIRIVRGSIGDQGNLAFHVTDVLSHVVLCIRVR